MCSNIQPLPPLWRSVRKTPVLGLVRPIVQHNPSTREVRINRDVVFDESASWYKPDATPSDPIEEELKANSDEETRPSPTSDKGKGKMREYEVEEPLDDRDSDDSAHSLDSELGVPIMQTRGVKKALTSTNEKLRRSS